MPTEITLPPVQRLPTACGDSTVLGALRFSVLELRKVVSSTCTSVSGAGLGMQSVGLPFLSLCVYGPMSSTAPATNYFDFYLHGHPLGVVGVQTRVHDFVHPGDHDFLKNVGYLFGLLLGARHDQLVRGEEVLVTASRRLL
jgi:hypothetical protein